METEPQQSVEQPKQTSVETKETKKLRINLNEAAAAIKELLFHFHELERLHPEEMEALKEKHPTLAKSIKRIDMALKLIELKYGEINGDKLKEVIDDYNSLARTINFVLRKIITENKEAKEKYEAKIIQIVEGNIEVDEKALTDAEKDSLRRFAKDIYLLMFPETYTDKFVKWSTGQAFGGDMNAAEKIAAAPMNGIESLVTGVAGFVAHPIDTTIATKEGMEKTWELLMSEKDRKRIFNAGKFLIKNTSASDKIAPVLSFLTTLIMAGGGVEKVGKMLKAAGHSKNFAYMISLARGASNISKLEKPLQLKNMLGITLPYLHL